MAQVINQGPGFGALLGTGLGQGISSGLQALANQKMNQLAQRQAAGGYTALGIPQADAAQIAKLPEAIQGVVLKNYLAAAEHQGLSQALGELQGMPSTPIQQQLQAQHAESSPAGMQAVQSLLQPQGSTQTQAMTPQVQQQSPQTFAQLLRAPRLSPENRLRLAGLSQQKELQLAKLSAKEQELVNKETKPYYDQLLKEADAAKKGDLRLGRMEKLLEEGKLPPAALHKTLKSLEAISPEKAIIGGAAAGFAAGGIPGGLIGGTLGALITPIVPLLEAGERKLYPAAEEFEKLSADFIKEAKTYFGSRLTDADLRAFMQTIPTLSQTKSGKEKIISNLKKMNEITGIKAKAMKAIIKENGGKRPINLAELVEERTAPEIDKVAQEFIEGLPKATKQQVQQEDKLSSLAKLLIPGA